MSGFEPPQKSSAKKAPDHSASPIERHKTGRALCGEPCDLRQTEIVHQKAPDRHFRTHITENPNRAEKEVAMFPDGIVGARSGIGMRGFYFGELGNSDQNRQQ